MSITRDHANIQIIRSKGWMDISVNGNPTLINMANVVAVVEDQEGKAKFYDATDDPFESDTDFEDVEIFLSEDI